MLRQHLELAYLQDFSIELRVRTDILVEVVAYAANGATTLNVKPLSSALLSGDKILFGNNLVVTLSSGASAQDTTVSVTAIDAPLNAFDVGRKLPDIASYTITFQVFDDPDETTVVLSGNISIDDPTEGHAIITGNCTITRKQYTWKCWRTNAGSARPLAQGDLLVY